MSKVKQTYKPTLGSSSTAVLHNLLLNGPQPNCGSALCDRDSQYCDKKPDGVLQCESCERLETRYNQVKAEQRQQQAANGALRSGKNSVQQRVVKLFEEKCVVYRNRNSMQSTAAPATTTGVSVSQTLNSSQMITITNPSASASAQREFRIVTEPAVVRSNAPAAVWSTADREALLIISCATAFMQLLMLFVLLLIFFRLMKRNKRDSGQTKEDDYCKKNDKKKLDPFRKRAQKRIIGKKANVGGKHEEYPLSPNSVGATPRPKSRNYTVVPMPIAQPVVDSADDNVVSVSACQTGALNSPELAFRNMTVNPYFQMQQSVCADCCLQGASCACGNEPCSYHLMPQSAEQQSIGMANGNVHT